ncbi:unnamed protein product [Amoebophrya sp. A25]|nr:unnamed protein product [Amoebophrya sp. A25]|eukprot:GSA25T00005560001.1
MSISSSSRHSSRQTTGNGGSEGALEDDADRTFGSDGIGDELGLGEEDQDELGFDDEEMIFDDEITSVLRAWLLSSASKTEAIRKQRSKARRPQMYRVRHLRPDPKMEDMDETDKNSHHKMRNRDNTRFFDYDAVATRVLVDDSRRRLYMPENAANYTKPPASSVETLPFSIAQTLPVEDFLKEKDHSTLMWAASLRMSGADVEAEGKKKVMAAMRTIDRLRERPAKAALDTNLELVMDSSSNGYNNFGMGMRGYEADYSNDDEVESSTSRMNDSRTSSSTTGAGSKIVGKPFGGRRGSSSSTAS